MKPEPFVVPRFTLGECTQRFIREDPARAVGMALLGGMLLTVLPVRPMLVPFFRLALALAKPILLMLGIAKLCEICNRKKAGS